MVRTKNCPRLIRQGRLGKHAVGENHNEAISLLAQADGNLQQHLQTLLSLKSKVQYTHISAAAMSEKELGVWRRHW
jgi:hypothetical protein